MRVLIVAVALLSTALALKVPAATSYNVVHHNTKTRSLNPFSSTGFSDNFGFYNNLFSKPQTAAVRSSPSLSPFQQFLRQPSSMCPVAPITCPPSRYRTLDGSCNNLQNPAWGVANSRYSRLLTPRYGDGISSPTVSVTGEDLPNARLISLIVFGEQDVPDPEFTLANMQWGQIITHDMSMQAGGTQSKRHGTRCCTDDGKLIDRSLVATTCFPILVPPQDPAHKQTGKECMNFVRTLTDLDQNCPGSNPPAEQLTTVTAYMDLSLVYGSSEAQNQPIRLFQAGRMVVDQRNGGEWPPQSPNATTDCDIPTPDEVCYLGGDTRINQNPGLTVLQIVLLREHNRIADTLAALNPHWDDETLFQEARRINNAQYQHISYWEWLPIFLGRENMIKNRLLYNVKPGSYVNDYDPTIDPSVLNSHATAAFRYFHSQIEGRLE